MILEIIKYIFYGIVAVTFGYGGNFGFKLFKKWRAKCKLLDELEDKYNRKCN